MLADLIQLIARRPPSEYERGFVREIHVRQKAPRNRRLERFMAICWIVILVKCVAVVWLFGHYHVPINVLWVIGPTLIFAALCTAVYLLRD